MTKQNSEFFLCGDPEDSINPVTYESPENIIDEKGEIVASIRGQLSLVSEIVTPSGVLVSHD